MFIEPDPQENAEAPEQYFSFVQTTWRSSKTGIHYDHMIYKHLAARRPGINLGGAKLPFNESLDQAAYYLPENASAVRTSVWSCPGPD